MLLMAFAAGTAQGALIAYEPFEGTETAAVDGTSGGAGWNGAWTISAGGAGSFTFVSPGMTFTEVETSGLKATYDPTGVSTTLFNRSLTLAITVDASNPEVWASALVEIGSGGGDVNSGRGIGVELTNSGTAVVGFGKHLNSNFGVGPAMSGAGWVNSTVPANSVGIRFVVLKLTFDGTDTVATVYVATDGDTIDITDPTTFTGTATTTIAGALTFDGVNLYGYHGGTTSNGVDEIKVADSYSDFFETDLANTPIPGDNVSGVSLTTDLSWQPPTPSTYIATGYDVWFGTEPNELDPAYDITQIAAKQAATAVLNADLVAAWGAGLVNGQKYYWQVDAYEPNVLGDALHPGDLWNFTAMPPNVIINDGPVSVTVAAGDEAVFTVDASNAAGYQWYKSTDMGVTYTELSGETLASLTLGNVQQTDEGWYFCHVDGIEPQDSAVARLMTERLVGHWTFDNTLDAAVGGLTAVAVDPNENNAIAPAIDYGVDADSMIGSGSLSLDNSEFSEGGWLTVPGSEELYNFYPQGLTISTWIKTTVSGYDEIVSKNYDDGASRFFHRIAGSNGLFRFGSAGAWTNGAINDGNWHLMVSTYDAATGTAQVYLDGEPRGSASMSPTSEGNLAPITIGGSALPDATKAFAWNGFIDDVKIYTYALTKEAIAQEYFDVTGVASCIYEFDGAAFDVNNDCVVNMADMAMVAQYWLDSGLYPPI